MLAEVHIPCDHKALGCDAPMGARGPLAGAQIVALMIATTILRSGSNYRAQNAQKGNDPLSGQAPEFFVKTGDCAITPGERALSRRRVRLFIGIHPFNPLARHAAAPKNRSTTEHQPRGKISRAHSPALRCSNSSAPPCCAAMVATMLNPMPKPDIGAPSVSVRLGPR